jgi:hypothetical protein
MGWDEDERLGALMLMSSCCWTEKEKVAVFPVPDCDCAMMSWPFTMVAVSLNFTTINRAVERYQEICLSVGINATEEFRFQIVGLNLDLGGISKHFFTKLKNHQNQENNQQSIVKPGTPLS